MIKPSPLNQPKNHMNGLTETATPAVYYDMSGLYEMTGGNREFITTLAKIYLDTIPANSAEMVDACNRGDWDTVSKMAHKLKSTVDHMRMTNIMQDIRAIELDGKNKVNKDSLPVLVEKVHTILLAVAEDLKEEFQL